MVLSLPFEVTKQPCNPRQSSATTWAPVLLRSSKLPSRNQPGCLGGHHCRVDSAQASAYRMRSIGASFGKCVGNNSTFSFSQRCKTQLLYTLRSPAFACSVRFYLCINLTLKKTKQNKTKMIYLARVVINRKTIPDDWRSGNTTWMWLQYTELH